MNPVLELSINSVSFCSNIPQSFENPVSNLGKSESQDRFFNLDSLLHLFDILRVLSWFLILSRLFGILTLRRGCSSFLICSCSSIKCDISDELCFKGFLEDLIKSGIGVGSSVKRISSFGENFHCREFFTLS